MTELVENVSTPLKAARVDPSPDLSAEIVLCVEKEPDDRVTCRRIWENKYRCNWWSAADASGYDNRSMGGLLVTTHRVRKSRFLNVTKGAKGLAISES